MGNLQSLQCIAPTAYDEELDLHLAQAGLEVKDYFACQSTATIHDQQPLEAANNPLRSHLRDRPHGILLDYGLVLAALVEQVEVLVRREEQQKASQHDCPSVESSKLGREKEMDYETESIFFPLPFVKARTDITNFSGITTKAGYTNTSKRTAAQKEIKKSTSAPPKPVGLNQLEEVECLRKQIRRMVADDGGNPFACGVLEPCPVEHEELLCPTIIKENTNILHLRVPIKCARYFYRQLLRWKPNDPLSRTIAASVTETELAPPRPSYRPKLLPELEHISDDSCSSSSDIDFGVDTPSSPVRLLVNDAVFLDLALTGALGLVNKKRRPKAVLVDREQLKSPDQYIVLLNRRSGIPLALMSLRTGNEGRPPVVRIYSSKRRRQGQRPAATTGKLGLSLSDSLPLYTWAEIVTEGIYPEQVRYSIYIVAGSDESFEAIPSYRAVHESPGSGSIRVVGRTEREAYHSDCATLSICRDGRPNRDYAFFKLSVSRGIDPALFICFAAFVDEALEQTMRIQCRSRI